MLYGGHYYEMNQLHRRVLQHLTVDFVDKMDPEEMKTQLYQRHMLTRDELEQLGLPIHTTRGKCMLILTKLPTKGSQAFDRFIECLEATSDRVPGHAELLEKINEQLEQLQHS